MNEKDIRHEHLYNDPTIDYVVIRREPFDSLECLGQRLPQ
jgi:hypothetical protein